MSNADPHVHIARKIRMVEQTKIALLDQVTGVFRSVQGGSERDIADSLGKLVGVAYVLGLALDVPPPAVDRAAAAGLPAPLTGELVGTEQWESVVRHLTLKR